MFYGQCWASTHPIPVLSCLGSLIAVTCRQDCQRKTLLWLWHLADCGCSCWRRSWDWCKGWLHFCLSSLSPGSGKCSMYCGLLISSETITFIINDPGRCSSPRNGWGRQKRLLLIRAAGGKCPGMSALVLSISMSDWREPANTLQLSWLHLSRSGLCSGALFTVWEVVFPVLTPSLLHPDMVQDLLPPCQP